MSFDLISVSRSAPTTTSFLFHLFADIILPQNDGTAWTGQILYFLDLLGVNERAGRTTLSRMRKQGWFESEKIGRRSRYTLTEKGRQIAAEHHIRMGRTSPESWDGEWHLAIFSLPEVMRGLRGDLRRQLDWQGYGQLAPGTWISPHDHSRDLEKFAGEMGIRPYVALFAGRQTALITDEEIVTRCWDLDSLADGYEKFIATWQNRLVKGDLQPGALTSLEDAFWARFFLTYDFLDIAQDDPHLPAVLLPHNWPGYTARRLLTYYRVQLGDRLRQFFDDIFES